MRPTSEAKRRASRSQGQPRKVSFIEEARRKQIIDTAIETIAEQGYDKASLAEIARAAGISKGVISYHFAGKDELVEEILSFLLREPAAFIKQRVDACERAIDKLDAYIRANFEFMREHRVGYVALVDLWNSRSVSAGNNKFDHEAYEPSRHYLMRILEQGQTSGAFREMPLRTMASLIQASIDGVMLQWVFHEDAIDLDEACDEITEMIRTHVR